MKIGNGETKHVLREYLRRAGQHAIADRRDKQGYPTPVGAWLSAGGGALPRELLLGDGARIHRYAEPRRLERLIALHARGVPIASDQLYRLIGTEVWLQTCIDGGV